MTTFRTFRQLQDDAMAYAVEARRHGYTATVLRWHAALDNYEPCPRATAAGYAVRYSGTLHDPETGFTAEYPTEGIYMPADDVSAIPLGNLTRAIALFDDGQSVQPYYAAGWNPYETDKQRDPALNFGSTGPSVLWHPFPLDGTGPKGPYSMAGWQLGPRRAYHFKVSYPGNAIPDSEEWRRTANIDRKRDII
jgi:hypothetical protein